MVVNGVESDWAPVLSSVPGTVLGPLLFSLYINDITKGIDSELSLFADDCVCYREIKNSEDTVKLQEYIDRFRVFNKELWYEVPVGQMQYNADYKVTDQEDHCFLYLRSMVLDNVEKIKYLVITITNDLKWSTYVSNICAKANRTFGFFRRNLSACPQDVKEAYKGLLRPVLEYGSSVWDAKACFFKINLTWCSKGQLDS